MQIGLDHLVAEINRAEPASWQGRVASIGRSSISVTGLSRVAALGHLVDIAISDTSRVRGEVLALQNDEVTVMLDAPADGVKVGAPVRLIGENLIAPDDSWCGRIVDAYGAALDGLPLIRGTQSRPLNSKPINPTERGRLGPRLETGLAVFNTLLPIARGQRLGLFAGSGVGKSTLLGKLVLGVTADIVVIAMIGERGRELKEFVERVLGKIGMGRTVVVTATSDQSALLRRRCAWTAMAVAEHFRDQGKHVLFVADSVTRFAEAHREIALTTGEPASLRGFPPSTASELMSLCERAGPGPAGVGDITAIFSVLVAASDMDEPVADILRGTLDGHIVLDRKIAERGRFPAIDVLRSVSRSLPEAANEAENKLIGTARRRLGAYEKNEIMIQAGLYEKGTDAEIDEAIRVWPALDAFVARSEVRDTDNSFKVLERYLNEGLDPQAHSQP